MSENNKYVVAAIDPGHSALGVSVACITNPYKVLDNVNANATELMKDSRIVEWLLHETIDTRSMIDDCNPKTCELHHTKHAIDKIDHLLQKYPCVRDADMLLIETQLPASSGLDIQNLLMARFARDKVQLVAPNTRNAFAKYKYEDQWNAAERRLARKDQTVAMVRQWADLPGSISDIHDGADAMFFIFMHFVESLLPQWKKDWFHANDVVPDDFFEQFMYQNNQPTRSKTKQ